MRTGERKYLLDMQPVSLAPQVSVLFPVGQRRAHRVTALLPDHLRDELRRGHVDHIKRPETRAPDRPVQPLMLHLQNESQISSIGFMSNIPSWCFKTFSHFYYLYFLWWVGSGCAPAKPWYFIKVWPHYKQISTVWHPATITSWLSFRDSTIAPNLRPKCIVWLIQCL